MPRTTYFDALAFPSRQELAAHYAKGTGRSVDKLDYYLVLAKYKGARILEYKVAAAMDGLQSKEIGEMFIPWVLDSAAEGEKLARRHT